MIETCLMIPLDIPAANSVNKTAGESSYCMPNAEVGSMATTVPSGKLRRYAVALLESLAVLK